MPQRPKKKKKTTPTSTPAPATPEPAPHPPRAPLSKFESLPDPCHFAIASFLPDGDEWFWHRLRLSQVSRTLNKIHGGFLTHLTMYRSTPDYQGGKLVKLVRRQRGLQTVRWMNIRGIPALTRLIADGSLRNVRELKVWMEFWVGGGFTSAADLQALRCHAGARGAAELGDVGLHPPR